MQVINDWRIHDIFVLPSFGLVKSLLILRKQVAEVRLESVTFQVVLCLSIIQKEMQIIEMAYPGV